MEFKNLFQNYKLETPKPQNLPKSRREEIINNFIEILNADRECAGYKKLSAGFYVSKMARAGIKSESQLDWFYRYCEDAKNFSSTWWWSLDSKNIKEKV